MRPVLTSLAAAVMAVVQLPSEAGALTKATGSKIEYNRDIRPILAENCFSCHGPDSASRKADLRLDSFGGATAERGKDKPAIVAGKPSESGLIARITTTDEDDVMPPRKTRKVLKPAEIELLRQWVAEGAPYQAHWSFLPPQKVVEPVVKDTAWARTAVDRFVLAGLEQAGLSPAAEADRTTLARRSSLDLTGLPPDPALVKEFVESQAPDAYEKLIDRLLSSKQYGEHRARYWLDAARYADSHGIHFDNYREIWSYREWVINAFNDNLPFDQFTVEQLAGDLLPKPTLEQRIASGFNRCNITTSEGGAIDEEYLVNYTRDRTETTSTVWMGLTAGCAVCHDHKFDPFSQKDFYQLAAYFNNTTQPAMDGNRRDTPPVIPVPTRQDRPRWEELPALTQAGKERLDRRRQSALDEFTHWVGQTAPETVLAGVPADGLQFSAPLKEANQPALTVFVNGYPRVIPAAGVQEGIIAPHAFVTSKELVPAIADAGNFERNQPFTVALWVRLNPDNKNGSLLARMDEDDNYRGWDVWLQDGRVGTHLVHKWADDAMKVVARAPLTPNRWTHVVITHNGSSKASGTTIYYDGRPQDLDRQVDKLENTILTKVPLKIGQRSKGSNVEKAALQDLRLYGRTLKAEEVLALRNRPRLGYLLAKSAESRSEQDQKDLYDGYLDGYDKEFQEARQVVANLEQEDREIRRRGTIAHVMNERDQMAEAYVLFRGEYDKRRDKVTAATPAMLPAMPASYPQNRLGLARWLLDKEHPLTARVTVNRVWQEVFGTGIVRTAGDFGISGELPSNQELLDWLAVDFREHGWDMKRLYRLLVMSATYRQAATVTEEKLMKDPQNRLLSRGPRFRMDGEMVRDYALAASGLLVEKIGGPSVRPYQPEGVWEMVAMIGSDTRDYKVGTGEDLYRRSMYTFWKRSAPPASMEVFNAPSRETCTVRRERTNTPLQALVTMNDTQFVEAARVLAERALGEGGASEAQRVDYMAQRLLARPLKEAERRVVLDALRELRSHYETSPKAAEELIAVGERKAGAKLAPVELAAYTMVANQLMNLDEVLNK